RCGIPLRRTVPQRRSRKRPGIGRPAAHRRNPPRALQRPCRGGPLRASWHAPDNRMAADSRYRSAGPARGFADRALPDASSAAAAEPRGFPGGPRRGARTRERLVNAAVHAMPFGAEWLAKTGHTRFRLWAPGLSSLSVHLLDIDERLPMKPAANGWFELVTAARPGNRYCFELPDGFQIPDPAS